jgi:hypothetical protein
VRTDGWDFGSGSKAPKRQRTQIVPVTPNKRKCSARSGVSALGQEETSLSIGRWRSLATDATLGFQRTINRTIALGGFKPV